MSSGSSAPPGEIPESVVIVLNGSPPVTTDELFGRFVAGAGDEVAD